MKGYMIGINSGFLSQNDVRRLEDMPLIPTPGGDRYRMNSAMQDIDSLMGDTE